MGSDAPIVGKALRLASFSITLSGIVILGTIGFSIYQEFDYLFFSAPEDLFQFRQEQSEDGMDIILDLTIPNKGMYPLEIAINVTATLGEEELVSGSSGVVVIPAGSEENVLLTLPVREDDLLILGPVDGEEMGMEVTIRAGFQPFAFITVSAGEEFVEQVGQLNMDSDLAVGSSRVDELRRNE